MGKAQLNETVLFCLQKKVCIFCLSPLPQVWGPFSKLLHKTVFLGVSVNGHFFPLKQFAWLQCLMVYKTYMFCFFHPCLRRCFRFPLETQQHSFLRLRARSTHFFFTTVHFSHGKIYVSGFYSITRCKKAETKLQIYSQSYWIDVHVLCRSVTDTYWIVPVTPVIMRNILFSHHHRNGRDLTQVLSNTVKSVCF